MNNIKTERPDLQLLPRIKERISFLYLEKCIINRSDNAISIKDVNGIACMPAAMIGALILGPGTTISHRAVELLGGAGATIIWVGEQGVRYYAHGRPLTSSSKFLIAQAKAVSNTRSRLAVARMMYQMRFPDEDVSGLTMQQLRGREGSRIRKVYRKMSEETGVPWNGRDYAPNNFIYSDSINMALSAANACLYGIAHSVIVALGCSPGLGFIHTGHDKSFVYDVADLYKTELTIPLAFNIAKDESFDIGRVTRRAVRDAVKDTDIMKRMAMDIHRLLINPANGYEKEDFESECLSLWDDKLGQVKSATAYGSDTDDDCEDI